MIRALIAAAILSMLSFSSIAGEQPKAAAIAVAESEGVVEVVSIDRKAYTAVVRTRNGATLQLNLPREAQNLDRVKPGDRFRMRYVEALALALHKGGSASASGGETVKLAPKGGTPGGVVVNTKNITAVVNAVDRSARTLAVKGPLKNVMVLKVADDVRSFDEIAIGDTI
ncbi:MAG: hypothetical protein ACXWUK_14595, partial [Burkholderiales bacterium]